MFCLFVCLFPSFLPTHHAPGGLCPVKTHIVAEVGGERLVQEDVVPPITCDQVSEPLQQQTSGLGLSLPSQESGAWPPVSGVRGSASRLRSPGLGLPSQESGARPPVSGVRGSASRLRSPGLGLPSQESGARPPVSGVWGSASRLRSPGLGLPSQESGARPPVSGVGLV